MQDLCTVLPSLLLLLLLCLRQLLRADHHAPADAPHKRETALQDMVAAVTLILVFNALLLHQRQTRVRACCCYYCSHAAYQYCHC
jgi:hypothetical protein